MLKHKLIAITATCLLTGGTISPTLAQTAPDTAPAATDTAQIAPDSAQTPSIVPANFGGPGGIQLLNEFRPIGGAHNNLQNPGLNANPGDPELSIAPLNFGFGGRLIDGPNPRTISNVISGGTGAQGQTSTTTDPGASAWLYVFGQFVDHDLDLESNTPQGTPINIRVPAGDPVFPDGSSIAMTRDNRDPRTNTIINTTAGYLDLSQLYGSTDQVANSLRNPDGTLKSSNNGQALPIVNDNFVTGDPRVMENPELVAVTTLFMREHNAWVATLRRQNGRLNGDQLYNMAKAITTAEYENIVYTEYLPTLMGPIPGYRGYNPQVNPQVTQEFAEAAFRMGHSQISGTQAGIDNNGNTVFTESLADAFFNTPEQDIANGINPLLRNVGHDNSQATDPYAVTELRNLLFAPLPGGNVDQIDLIAIDIQRERDAGLGSLNDTRRALHMAPYTSFSDLTSDAVLQRDLQNIYRDIDNVDLFVGGLAEAHVNNGRLGQTFQAIIGSQFQRLRAGDRFWWQNENFDPQTANMISDMTLATLVRRNTDSTNIQDHVFVPPAPAPAPRPQPLTAPGTVTNSQGRPFAFPR